MHGNRINHGCQHSHIIGAGPLNSGSRPGNTAKYITRPDYQTDLDAHFMDDGNLVGDPLDGFGIKAEFLRPHQPLTGQF